MKIYIGISHIILFALGQFDIESNAPFNYDDAMFLIINIRRT